MFKPVAASADDGHNWSQFGHKGGAERTTKAVPMPGECVGQKNRSGSQPVTIWPQFGHNAKIDGLDRTEKRCKLLKIKLY